MGTSFTLVSIGAVLIFLGLLDGGLSLWHDLGKFGGVALVSVGLVGSAVVAARRRQAERVARLREGLPQVEPIGRSDAAH